VAQVLADLEERQPLGGDRDRLAGLGVAAGVGLVVARREAAESADLDALSALHRVEDALEHGVDGRLGLLLRQVVAPRQNLDELGSVHVFIPPIAATWTWGPQHDVARPAERGVPPTGIEPVTHR